MKKLHHAVYPAAVAQLQSGLTALVNSRGQVLALRATSGAVTCTDRHSYRTIKRGSAQVRAWVELYAPDADDAERHRLASRTLRSWRLKIPTEASDRLEPDRARERALQAARMRRLEAKGDVLKKLEARMAA